MRRAGPRRREGAVDLTAGEIRVHAGFRVVTREPLAGGPIELEFFVENAGSTPLQLAVGGDRLRQRPGGFSFAADLDGAPLADPLADLPNMGGPLGVVPVNAQAPWRQPLVLNDFVRLEDSVAMVPEGGTARLRLLCHRPIVLASTSAAALAAEGADPVDVALEFDLRRDDAELGDVAAGLVEAVTHGPPAERERPLALLLSMRAAARAQIETLTKHADQAVADRARRALTRSR